ncbi:hypothetical protein [Longimicrobium sp.]|uniref:hypothetical protein n=1 Tax=Longimicrobium sp. TaxID=2029185 RepID=UPI003B3A7304
MLITCPDCRREISDAAPACIHCGRPTTPVAPRVDAPACGPRRTHPLAGPAPGSAIRPRVVLRWIAVAAVVGLFGAQWALGGASERTDLLISALLPIAIGAILLLAPAPETTARTAGARRGNWGTWFTENNARRAFGWNAIAGWVFLLIGLLTLLFSLL